MDKRIFMLLGAIITVGAIVVVLRYFLSDRVSSLDCGSLNAGIYPEEIEIGGSISYFDQTPDVKERKWEFDDGTVSDSVNGKHIFAKEGSHSVKLTINGTCDTTYTINVKSLFSDTSHAVAIRIDGPDKVYAGEKVQFKCSIEGGAKKDIKYSWKFGESGREDSKDQNPYYTFQYPNTEGFRISVFTTASLNTAYKTVVVLPPKPIVPVHGGTIPQKKLPGGGEIKTFLQKVADRDGGYTSADLNWMKEYFLGSTLIKISCNLPGVNRLDILFEKFGVNPGMYEVIEATPINDNSIQKIMSINVKVKEKSK